MHLFFKLFCLTSPIKEHVLQIFLKHLSTMKEIYQALNQQTDRKLNKHIEKLTKK